MTGVAQVSKDWVRPPAAPSRFDATAEWITTETERLLEHAKAVQDGVVATVSADTASFENTLLPLVHEENQRLYQRQLIEFYGQVSPDEKIREASVQAEDKFAAFTTETATRKDLYSLLAAVRNKGDAPHGEAKRLLEKLTTEFERNGLALAEADQSRLREVDKQLRQLRQDFLSRVNNDDAHVYLTKEALDGVSESLVGEFEKGTGENEGKLKVTFEGMRYYDIRGSAKSQDSRRKIFTARSESTKENLPVLQDSIKLRQEKAGLLGFPSYLAFSMATEMEKSPEVIKKFLEDLLEKARPVRHKDVAELRKAKAQDLKDRGEYDDGKFYEWDSAYYAKKAATSEQSADGQKFKVAEYFALEETISRMLQVISRVMGLSFAELGKAERDDLTQGNGDSLLWHESVRLFAVWDDSDGSGENKDFLGYLYMDMYPRPGKRSGFADLPIHPAFTDEHGQRKFTSTGLVCNYDPPTKTKPTLLSHGEVVLLFHELGHGIHDLVAKTHYARFHGASTAGDFNEAPSQMLEEWCWHAPTLRLLSRHYANLSPQYLAAWRKEQGDEDAVPPDALPEERIAGLVEQKKKSNMQRTIVLLDMSLFSMALNGVKSPEEADRLDVVRLYHELTSSVMGVDMPDEPQPPCPAADASLFTVEVMYIYLVSQIYSMDMFHSAFLKDPMDREQGLRYRKLVIGNGSSVDEMEMLKSFLGRAPTLDAFYAEMGLTSYTKIRTLHQVMVALGYF